MRSETELYDRAQERETDRVREIFTATVARLVNARNLPSSATAWCQRWQATEGVSFDAATPSLARAMAHDAVSAWRQAHS